MLFEKELFDKFRQQYITRKDRVLSKPVLSYMIPKFTDNSKTIFHDYFIKYESTEDYEIFIDNSTHNQSRIQSIIDDDYDEFILRGF
jgi:hypothetical protein